MISKDSDFLNERLKQLKASVLTPKPQTHLHSNGDFNGRESVQAPTSFTSHNGTSFAKKTEPANGDLPAFLTNKTNYGPRADPPAPQTTSYAEALKPRMSYAEYERKLHDDLEALKFSSQYSNSDIKRPRSHRVEVIERNMFDSGSIHLNVNNDFKNSSISTSNLYKDQMDASEPKVKTVFAVNGATRIGGFYKEKPVENKTADYINIINNQESGTQSFYNDVNLSRSSYKLKTESSPLTTAQKFSTIKTFSLMPGNNIYTATNDTEMESDVLKSLNQQSFLSKHEHKMVSDLATKYQAEIDVNNKRSEEIMIMRQKLEAEKRKTIELDEQCRNEFKHYKAKETEVQQNFQKLNNTMNEISQKEIDEENRATTTKSKLDQFKKENDLLRSEIKRLGEMTSEKILDLENNINAISRMRDFEVENFEMEKEKIVNSADFVIEQMKVHFNDRSIKIDDQTRKAGIDKDKAASDLKMLTEELRAFNSNADIRITNTMNIIIQEETERHQKEMREVEIKIRAEEEEIAQINRRNQELINRLHATEREGKSRIMARKNENVQLKEDLSGIEQAYNKLLIQISNESKEIDKKRDIIEGLNGEVEELKEKTRDLEQKYAEEVDSINLGNQENHKELEEMMQHFVDEERRLMDEIREENNRVYEIQRQHAGLIEQIKQNINNSVQSQFSRVSHTSKKNFE